LSELIEKAELYYTGAMLIKEVKVFRLACRLFEKINFDMVIACRV